MNNVHGLSKPLALRIGLAVRSLPEIPTVRLMNVLVDALGLPLTEQKLNGVTVKTLKTGLDGALSEIDAVYLKQAVQYLKGERGLGAELELPEIEPYQDGDIPNSIRVAFASNSGERLDGHFGSCARFLIYQVAAHDARLIDIRPIVEPETHIKDEKNAYRARLIGDCQMVYVVSIGGPPAAKVVNAGIHPIKHPQEAEIRDVLPSLQEVLAGSPPPWLAKLIGAAPRQEAEP